MDERTPALASVGPLLLRRTAEREIERLLATPGLLLPAAVPEDDDHDTARWRYGPLYRKVGDTAIVAIKGVCIPSKDMGMAPWTNSYERTTQACEALIGEAKAGRVKLVVFDVNSPGGLVAGCQSAVVAIEALGKVVETVAYVDGEVCSAAFWQAAACRRIVITPASGAGCIGAAMHFVVWNEDVVRVEHVVSSQTPYKIPDVDDKDDRARLQRQVDMIADVFLSDLARLRRLPSAEAVAKQYALGDVLIGADALAAGMVDEIAMLPAAFRAPDSPGGTPATNGPAAGRKGTAMQTESSEPAGPDVAPITAERDRLQAELTTARAELATERNARAQIEQALATAQADATKARTEAADVGRRLEAHTALFEGRITAEKVADFQKAAAERDAGRPDWFNSQFASAKAGSAWPGGSGVAVTHGGEVKASVDEADDAAASNAVLALARKKGIGRNEAHAEIKAYAAENRMSFNAAAHKLAAA